MSMMEVKVKFNSTDLLQAAEQLSSEELNDVVQTLLALKARRQTTTATASETELLQKINQASLSPDQQTQYLTLLEKRQNEMLSAAELDELQQLTQQYEALNVERLTFLQELAQLRGLTLSALLTDLGLDQPNYV